MASTTDITLSHIGLLSNLKTTDKSNIVNAINEIYTKVVPLSAVTYVNCSTTLAYTGIYVTIPAYSYGSLTFKMCFNYAPPKSILLCNSNSVVNISTSISNGGAIDNYASCSTSFCTDKDPYTIYCWGSVLVAGANNIMYSGYYIQFK